MLFCSLGESVDRGGGDAEEFFVADQRHIGCPVEGLEGHDLDKDVTGSLTPAGPKITLALAFCGHDGARTRDLYRVMVAL